MGDWDEWAEVRAVWRALVAARVGDMTVAKFHPLQRDRVGIASGRTVLSRGRGGYLKTIRTSESGGVTYATAAPREPGQALAWTLDTLDLPPLTEAQRAEYELWLLAGEGGAEAEAALNKEVTR